MANISMKGSKAFIIEITSQIFCFSCWMKHSVYVFGFIVPAVFVLVVNLILIAVIMRKVCCANGNAKMKAHLPPHCKTTYLAMTLFGKWYTSAIEMLEFHAGLN